MLRKASMMPYTVPNRPMNGAVDPIVPKRAIHDSRWLTSFAAARLVALSTCRPCASSSFASVPPVMRSISS